MVTSVGRNFLRSLTVVGSREKRTETENKPSRDAKREALPRPRDRRIDKAGSEKAVRVTPRDPDSCASAGQRPAKTPRASEQKGPRRSKQDVRNKGDKDPPRPTTPKRDGCYYTEASFASPATPVKDVHSSLASKDTLAGLVDFSPRSFQRGPKDPLTRKKSCSGDTDWAATPEAFLASPRTPMHARKGGKAAQPSPHKSIASPGTPKNLMIRARSFGPLAPSPATPVTPSCSILSLKHLGKSVSRVASEHRDVGPSKSGPLLVAKGGADPEGFSLDGTPCAPGKRGAFTRHALSASASEAEPLVVALHCDEAGPHSLGLVQELAHLRRQCHEAELARVEAQAVRAEAESALRLVVLSRADVVSELQRTEQRREAAEAALAGEREARCRAELVLNGAEAEFCARENALQEAAKMALSKLEAVLAEKAELEAMIVSLRNERVVQDELEAGTQELSRKLRTELEAMEKQKGEMDLQLRASEAELEETKSRLRLLESRLKELQAEVAPAACTGADDLKVKGEERRSETQNRTRVCAFAGPGEELGNTQQRQAAAAAEGPSAKHVAIEWKPRVDGPAIGNKGEEKEVTETGKQAKAGADLSMEAGEVAAAVGEGEPRAGDRGESSPAAAVAAQAGAEGQRDAKRDEVLETARDGADGSAGGVKSSVHTKVEELLRDKASLEQRMEKAIAEALIWVDRSEALEARLAEEEARLAEQAQMWERKLEVEEKVWAAQRLVIEAQAEGRLQQVLELQQTILQLKKDMFQLQEDTEAREKSLESKLAALEDEKATLCEESAYMLSKFRAGVEAFDSERKEWEEERWALQMLRVGAQEMRSEHEGVQRAMDIADRLEEQLAAAEAARAALGEEVAMLQEIMRQKAAAYQVEMWSLQQRIRELESDSAQEFAGEAGGGPTESAGSGTGVGALPCPETDSAIGGEARLVPMADSENAACKGARGVPPGPVPGVEACAIRMGEGPEQAGRHAAGAKCLVDFGGVERTGEAVELTSAGQSTELCVGHNNGAAPVGMCAQRLAELEALQQELQEQVEGLKMENSVLKETLGAVSSLGDKVQAACSATAPGLGQAAGSASFPAVAGGEGRGGNEQQPWNLSLFGFLPKNFQSNFSSETGSKQTENNGNGAPQCSLPKSDGDKFRGHRSRFAECECDRGMLSPATSTSSDSGSEAELRVPSSESCASTTSFASSCGTRGAGMGMCGCCSAEGAS